MSERTMSERTVVKRKSNKVPTTRSYTKTETIIDQIEISNIDVYFGNEEKKKLYHKQFPNNRITTTK